MDHSKAAGIVLVLLAAFFFAWETILVELSLNYSSALSIVTVALLTTSVLCIVFVASGKRSLSVSKKELLILLGIGIIGTGLANWLYYYAISTTYALNANLLSHTFPVFIAIIAFFLLRERLSKLNWFGAVVLLGASFVVAARSLDNIVAIQFGQQGDLYALMVAVLWAIVAVIIKKYLNHLNTGVIAFYIYFSGGLSLLLYILATTNLEFSYLSLLVGFAMGIANLLYIAGLKRITATLTGFLTQTSIVFTAVLAFFVLQESATIIQLLAIPFIFVGMALLTRSKARAKFLDNDRGV